MYDLTPSRDLRLAQAYHLEIAPGVETVYGNVASAKAFTGAVRTYGALAIVPTPAPGASNGGRFANGDPAIAFDNPLDPKSIAGAVTVSPAPANVKALTQLSDDATSIAIDPYALDPNTTYAVTIAPEVKDIFGQTLGQRANGHRAHGRLHAGCLGADGLERHSGRAQGRAEFLRDQSSRRSLSSRVRANARAKSVRLRGSDSRRCRPHPAGPRKPLRAPVATHKASCRVPLQREIGGAFGALAYGFRTALDSPNSSPSLTGIAQLTNLGVFGQFFPANGFVLVQHLSDGAPAAGVAVTLYRIVGRVERERHRPAQCAAATTGSTGEADFRGVDLERCYAGSSANEAPNLGIVATEGADTATLSILGSNDVYRFPINPGWSNGAPLSRGIVFSDRQMYQPGERGEITGVAYYVSGTRVVADRERDLSRDAPRPDQQPRLPGSVQTDAYGIFSMPIAFSKQQALGYYTVDAKGSNGNDINGSLRVAEFKPPNFKLTLDVSATAAPAGGSVHASAAAAYLFGAPLQGGAVHAYVTREAATVTPKGWDDFWFGRQWFWPENTPSFDTDVLQRDLPLDAQGKTTLDVPVPASLPFPMTYTVDMEASDVSNLSVSDSKTFLALPADAVIGLASDVVGTAGKPMAIRAIVTGADGTAIARP